MLLLPGDECLRLSSDECLWLPSDECLWLLGDEFRPLSAVELLPPPPADGSFPPVFFFHCGRFVSKVIFNDRFLMMLARFRF